MERKKPDQTLQDLGERQIVRKLISPRFPNVVGHPVAIGDDCAVLAGLPHGHKPVLTIDPCPTPVVCLVEPVDYYHYGRLTALINVSDLAAMGAQPLGLVVSTVMPEKMHIHDYERFLDGLSEACTEWKCPVVGGNIKDGPDFTATGSALGFVRSDRAMTRYGAQVNDLVCVIGEMGLLLAAVLTRLKPEIDFSSRYRSVLDTALYRPVARLREGAKLAGSGRITSCIDSSDGIVGCLREVALVNKVDILISDSALTAHPVVSQVALGAGFDPRKIMLAWGDWQLVCTVPPDALEDIEAKMRSLGAPFRTIAEVRPGSGIVWYQENNNIGILSNFASELFSNTSFFTHGLDAYLNFLQSVPLYTVP